MTQFLKKTMNLATALVAKVHLPSRTVSGKAPEDGNVNVFEKKHKCQLCDRNIATRLWAGQFRVRVLAEAGCRSHLQSVPTRCGLIPASYLMGTRVLSQV
jgi:hypothetical protein